MKICNICKKKKRLSSFGKDRSTPTGLSYHCKVCDRKKVKEYRERVKYDWGKKKAEWRAKYPAKALWAGIKNREENRGVYCDITFEEFEKWHAKQEKVCVYCGLGFRDDNKWLKESIDRIVPAKGYSLDNIALCHLKCNIIKSDILDFEQMKEIGRKYIRQKLTTMVN